MMQTKPLSVEEICSKLRPVLGEKIDDIYFRYTVAATREEREDIAHMLNALYMKHLTRLLDKGVLLEPPKEGVLTGTYKIGDVHYSGKSLYPFNLREQDWKRHVCITGMSGSGKTTLAFTIAEALNAHKKNFLIFDWKKSFRPLLGIHPELAIFTVGDPKVTNLFKTNINRPPKGVSPKEWINVLVDLLIESFFASFGVHKVLLETLDEAFKEWGVYEGSENYPTWKHIKWRLEEKFAKVEGRESGWVESALRIATVLTFGEFGEILNYKGADAVTVEDLLTRKVIMELNSLGNIEKKFFCEFILTYIYKLKKAQQNQHDKAFDHAIIVDEAHNIFLKKPTTFANESVTDMIYREMREYGTGLVCLDQHISMISDTVKGNSACVIAFQQQLPADIEDISRLMQLQENKHYFGQLEVGEAIVKLAERYKSPFLIKAPFSQTRKTDITNEDVRRRAQAVLYEKKTKQEDPQYLKTIQTPTKEKKKKETERKKEARTTINIPKLTQIQPSPLTITKKPVEKKEQKNPTEPSIPPQKQENKQATKIQREIPPKPIQKSEQRPLTEVQQMIASYVKDHLAQGISLEIIEETLEKSKTSGNYTTADIMRVINEFMSHRIEVTKARFKKEKGIENISSFAHLRDDERKFVEFLLAHPAHNLSTVELYKAIGLSARKGTIIKKALEAQGLLNIESIKYDKGWKKFIRLHHTQN